MAVNRLPMVKLIYLKHLLNRKIEISIQNHNKIVKTESFFETLTEVTRQRQHAVEYLNRI